jgi:hypothetical protein
LGTGGEPHDPEEGQPDDLKGKLGGEGVVTEETDDVPEQSKMSF